MLSIAGLHQLLRQKERDVLYFFHVQTFHMEQIPQECLDILPSMPMVINWYQLPNCGAQVFMVTVHGLVTVTQQPEGNSLASTLSCLQKKRRTMLFPLYLMDTV